MSLNTPIAFLIFNRPDLTQMVFEAIRNAKPSKLLVIADGPRQESEEEKCEQARAVFKGIDWDCELFTNYSKINLGCKNRVSSGINWVFEQVEEAIILEDDCLPHPSFFGYCQALLNRYRNDERIMHIAGVNFQNGIIRGEGSYYFSKYPHIWGWATWKRAWKHYDVTMAGWPDYKLSEQFRNWCFNEQEQEIWRNNIEKVFMGETDTWDFQWVFTVMKNHGYCIMPNNNLVANIGFRSDATHTRESNSQMSGQPVSKYFFPDNIAHVKLDTIADRYTFNNVFNRSVDTPESRLSEHKGQSLLFNSIKKKLKSLFN